MKEKKMLKSMRISKNPEVVPSFDESKFKRIMTKNYIGRKEEKKSCSKNNQQKKYAQEIEQNTI